MKLKLLKGTFMHAASLQKPTLKALCANIICESIKGIKEAPDDYRKLSGAVHYYCALSYQGRIISIDYWLPRGYRYPPDAFGVMRYILDDALAVADPFSVWASDLGYDDGDQCVQALYKALCKQTSALRIFLAADYDAFLYADAGN